MTREEATIILDTFKNNPLFNEQHKQAFDIAISALSAIEDIKAEIADEYADTHHMYPDYAGGLSRAYGIIDKHNRKGK